MNLKRALEKNGFTVQKENDGWFVGQFTPAGEDWGYGIAKLNDMIGIAENFDTEEEFRILYEAKQNGFQGVPDVPTLWEDQVWKLKTLGKVLEDIE